MLAWLAVLSEKFLLKSSSGEEIAGLWVGTWKDESPGDIRRVEEALDLIKNNDPLQYAHVTRYLKRIWSLYWQAIVRNTIDRSTLAY
jgi:hypothetical protein